MYVSTDQNRLLLFYCCILHCVYVWYLTFCANKDYIIFGTLLDIYELAHGLLVLVASDSSQSPCRHVFMSSLAKAFRCYASRSKFKISSVG